ncbi:MAG TPA: hypothetical protein VMW00_01530 [Dehalococcoidales bacterium]|nr:hypothetical protein [Dehalococcoidales bacterium]
MYKGIYSNKFDFFAYGFMALVSMGLSVYAIYLLGGTSMTQPLPTIVLPFLIAAGLFALMALYSRIRMWFAPKDTRLDDLINAVKALRNTDDSNIPKITIDTKIDTADISSMNAEQLDKVSDIIKQLQGESTKEEV